MITGTAKVGMHVPPQKDEKFLRRIKNEMHMPHEL
jgi:hypothetical protein